MFKAARLFRAPAPPAAPVCRARCTALPPMTSRLSRLGPTPPRLPRQLLPGPGAAFHTRSGRILCPRDAPRAALAASRAFHSHSGAMRYPRGPFRAVRPPGSESKSPLSPFLVILIVSGGSAVAFYVANLEEVPVSGRKRFNCAPAGVVEEQGLLMYNKIMQEERGRLLPDSDPLVLMVKRVLDRLIEGGELGSGTEGGNGGWEVHVIDDPDTTNAFVLPGGKVFVYSGILSICRTDGGVAAVLSHEIAHNVAQHAAEQLSSVVAITPIIWLLTYLEVYLTGTTTGLGRFLADLLLEIGIRRPASRQQESEADYIGLLLMAKSCYDPRDAVRLWQAMEAAQREDAPPEWLSTHPSNETRVVKIADWLPKAEDAFLASNCSPGGMFVQDFRRAFRSL